MQAAVVGGRLYARELINKTSPENFMLHNVARLFIIEIYWV